MYSRYQGIDDANSAIKEYSNQLADLKSELSKTSSAIELVIKEREASRMQLACGLLTSNTEQDVSVVSNEIGAIHLKIKHGELRNELERDNSLLNKTKNNELYINRETYLHPVAGSITKPLQETKQLLIEIESSIKKLEVAPHFDWVKREIRSDSGFLSLIKALVTLNFLYKNKRLKSCKAKIGNLPDAMDKHDELLQHKKDTLVGIDTLEQQKKPIIDAINLVEELTEKTINFDKLSLNILRDVVAEHFNGCDLKQILSTIREDAKILLSKLDALRNKEKHLLDIKIHIESEISDRQQRQSKIQNVLYKWQRSNKSYLSGDKSKWLKDTPSGCRNRTNRFIDSYSDNRHHISSYNDYNGYNSAFCTGLMFSSFAVFSSDSDLDNYVSREIYSEHSELMDSGEEVLEGSELLSTIESDMLEENVMESDMIDEVDAS